MKELTSSGLALSSEANTKINELLEFVQTTSEAIEKINDSSQKQASNAGAINSTVQEMASYITNTSQLVQELDDAINSLAIKDEEEESMELEISETESADLS